MRGIQTSGRGICFQDSRIHERFETGQLVEVFGDELDVVGRLENLSRSGAKAYLFLQCDLEVGQSISVNMLDGTGLNGEVTWRRQNIFGLNFSLYLQDTMDHLYFDHLGADYYRRLSRLQSKAQKAMQRYPLPGSVRKLA